ncbi:MAG: hypothetical protein AB7N76_06210 [Planctomycetota bacterium]
MSEVAGRARTFGLGLLLGRELSRLDRAGGRRRLVRVATVLFFAAVCFGAADAGPQAPFRALIWAQLTLTLFLQPVRAAGLLVEGRLDGTLRLLGLTPLRPSVVLAGVCAAALALACEGFLLSLPLISIAAAYGGLPPADVARAALALLVAAGWGTAIGAWVGTQGERLESGAFLRALSYTFLFFVLAGVLWATAQSVGSRASPGLLLAAKLCWLPYALDFAQPDGWLGLVGASLLGALLFAHGTRRLERTILQSDGQPRAMAAARRGSRPVPPRQVVAWRERNRQDTRGWIRPGFLAVTLVCLFFAICMLAGLKKGQTDIAVFFALELASTLWLLLLVWGLMTGARSYVEDREDGSLELVLLSTRYSVTRLASEKLAGGLRRGAWGVAAGALLHGGATVALCLLRDTDPLTLLAAPGLVIALWLVGAASSLALGQAFSVSGGTTVRAQAWAASTAAALFFGGSITGCIFNSVLIVPGAGSGPIIGCGVVQLGLLCFLGFALFLAYGTIRRRIPVLLGE